MSGIAELLEHVKAATGPDRELDAAIYCAFTETAFPDETDEQRMDYAREFSPHVTDSIDAALALVERCLPKWPWLMRQIHDGHYFARLESPDFKCFIWEAGDHQTRDITSGTEVTGNGSSAPLAILAALLTALQDSVDARD